MYAFSSPAFWTHLFTRFHCCYCGSEEGYSSRRRNVFERDVLPLLFLRPVRCGDCFRRSYVPASVPVLRRAPGDRLDSTVPTLVPPDKPANKVPGKQLGDPPETPKRVA